MLVSCSSPANSSSSSRRESVISSHSQSVLIQEESDLGDILQAGRIVEEKDSQDGTTIYGFDARGNLIEEKAADSTTNYNYTAENRLV